MKREDRLEHALRQLVVTFLLDDRFLCRLCGGKWTLEEARSKRERHVKTCVLRKRRDFAQDPSPPIPF